MIGQVRLGESGGVPVSIVNRSVGSQSPLVIGSQAQSEAFSDYKPPR